jgi:hypothetical protein
MIYKILENHGGKIIIGCGISLLVFAFIFWSLPFYFGPVNAFLGILAIFAGILYGVIKYLDKFQCTA